VVNPLVWQADFLQLRPESRPVGWRSVGHPLHACNSLVLIVELQSPPHRLSLCCRRRCRPQRRRVSPSARPFARRSRRSGEFRALNIRRRQTIRPVKFSQPHQRDQSELANPRDRMRQAAPTFVA